MDTDKTDEQTLQVIYIAMERTINILIVSMILIYFIVPKSCICNTIHL